MGDWLAPFGTLDTSLGSSQKEVSETEYRQPFAEVVDHPLVNRFLHSQARVLGYHGVFNSVKHAKNFVHKHFKGTASQEVYHQEEHHCASATWGGRGKQAEVRITKAAPGYYRTQRDLYVSTTGKELSHRSDGNKVVDVSGSQRILGMEILEAVEDIRSAVAGLASPPSAVCQNLDRVYRKSKQTNLFSKEDVAR